MCVWPLIPVRFFLAANAPQYSPIGFGREKKINKNIIYVFFIVPPLKRHPKRHLMANKSTLRRHLEKPGASIHAWITPMDYLECGNVF